MACSTLVHISKFLQSVYEYRSIQIHCRIAKKFVSESKDK